MVSRRYALIACLLLAGCGSGHTFDSPEDARSTLYGKTQQEVIKLLGRPTGVDARDSANIERWRYRNVVRHPATGRTVSMAVVFRGNSVIDTEFF
jgi:hypothetical protein